MNGDILESVRKLQCTRCNHQWRPIRSKLPGFCPRCNSPYWNRQRTLKPSAFGHIPREDFLNIYIETHLRMRRLHLSWTEALTTFGLNLESANAFRRRGRLILKKRGISAVEFKDMIEERIMKEIRRKK